MKKKVLIASGIILVIFVIAMVFSLPLSKKRETPPSLVPSISQEKAAQQTQDDLTAAKAIEKIHSDYPWYRQIPIESEDYRIVFDFAKNSFRIRLLTKSTEAIKQAALNDLKTIGVNLDFYKYYFLEPKPGFQQLLP